MPDTHRLVAVIPAFNEAGHVGRVVASVRPFADDVVVVDDGSCDGTGEEARAAGARVYRHLINRGLGGAITTGLRAAVRLDATIIVTLDADGQHLATDIPRVVEPIRQGRADFVVGSRLLDPRGMPPSRRLANRVADVCTRLLFGVRVNDSQSGFRALTGDVARAMDIRSSRMEISTELVVEAARQGCRLMEVPITVIYTRYSLSKGQSFRVGLQTLAKLVLRRIG